VLQSNSQAVSAAPTGVDRTETAFAYKMAFAVLAVVGGRIFGLGSSVIRADSNNSGIFVRWNLWSSGGGLVGGRIIGLGGNFGLGSSVIRADSNNSSSGNLVFTVVLSVFFREVMNFFLTLHNFSLMIFTIFWLFLIANWNIVGFVTEDSIIRDVR